MNKDQGSGVVERVLYGAIMYLVLKYGASFGFSPDDAAWLAGGGVALAGGVWAWWHNRPVAVLNRAGNVIPDNATLVITADRNASMSERTEVHALATAANDRVIADTAR